jgi:biotin-(acetyl-CoA carboxylase) ligase
VGIDFISGANNNNAPSLAKTSLGQRQRRGKGRGGNPFEQHGDVISLNTITNNAGDVTSYFPDGSTIRSRRTASATAAIWPLTWLTAVLPMATA